MTKPIIENQTTYKILYFRYKKFIVPTVVIFICFILFLELIIPQFQQYIDSNSQLEQSRLRITILSQNLAFVRGLDQSVLDKQLKTVSQILPLDKDYIGILNSVSSAAVSSGVVLADYTFQVGLLSNSTGVKNLPLQLVLSITGNIDAVNKFIINLKNQSPLADVVEVNLSSGGNSVITVNFFNKQSSQIIFKPDYKLDPLSSKDLEILTRFSSP